MELSPIIGPENRSGVMGLVISGMTHGHIKLCNDAYLESDRDKLLKFHPMIKAMHVLIRSKTCVVITIPTT